LAPEFPGNGPFVGGSPDEFHNIAIQYGILLWIIGYNAE
jgi:hypothetical protein